MVISTVEVGLVLSTMSSILCSIFALCALLVLPSTCAEDSGMAVNGNQNTLSSSILCSVLRQRRSSKRSLGYLAAQWLSCPSLLYFYISWSEILDLPPCNVFFKSLWITKATISDFRAPLFFLGTRPKSSSLNILLSKYCTIRQSWAMSVLPVDSSNANEKLSAFRRSDSIVWDTLLAYSSTRE